MRDPVVMTGLTILVIAGIILAYPIVLVVIAGAAIVAVAISFTKKACDSILEADHTRATRDRELADHADQEHALVMAGDERGVYGQYKPYC